MAFGNLEKNEFGSIVPNESNVGRRLPSVRWLRHCIVPAIIVALSLTAIVLEQRFGGSDHEARPVSTALFVAIPLMFIHLVRIGRRRLNQVTLTTVSQELIEAHPPPVRPLSMIPTDSPGPLKAYNPGRRITAGEIFRSLNRRW